MKMFIFTILLLAIAMDSSTGRETGTIVDCSTPYDEDWSDCFDETDASGNVVSYHTKQELIEFAPDPAVPSVVTCILVEHKEECPPPPPSGLSPSGGSNSPRTNSTTNESGKNPCGGNKRGSSPRRGHGGGNRPPKGNPPRRGNGRH